MPLGNQALYKCSFIHSHHLNVHLNTSVYLLYKAPLMTIVLKYAKMQGFAGVKHFSEERNVEFDINGPPLTFYALNNIPDFSGACARSALLLVDPEHSKSPAT